MVFPLKIFIQQNTKKFDIACLSDWKFSNFDINSYRAGVLQDDLKIIKLAFLYFWEFYLHVVMFSLFLSSLSITL